MSDDATNLIAVIEKNRREEIRISLDEFNGYDLISIRIWAERRDGAGDERIPTKAGIAAKITLLPALIAALQKAEETAQRAGLLP
jgi:hypothetical protein